jgi:hypothetical protein
MLLNVTFTSLLRFKLVELRWKINVPMTTGLNWRQILLRYKLKSQVYINLWNEIFQIYCKEHWKHLL